MNDRTIKARDMYPNIPNIANIKANNGYLSLELPIPHKFRYFLPVFDDAPLHDRGEAHLTVIDPKEFKILRKKYPAINDHIFRLSVKNLRYIGLGIQKATEGENRVYFIVAEWPAAQRLRKALGLPYKDFHVTIAFHEDDIHNVSKDRSTLIPGFSASTIHTVYMNR